MKNNSTAKAINPSQLFLWVVSIFLFFIALGASANPLNWNTKVHSYFTQKEMLSNVLHDISASESTSLVINEQVVDHEINLNHIGTTTGEIFNNLIHRNHLMWYYDEDVLYVYNSDDIVTGTVKLNHLTPGNFAATLESMSVTPHSFKWRIKEKERLLLFSGPRRQVERIMEMAQILDKKQLSNTRAIYKWTDANGMVHLSVSLPEGQIPEQVYDASASEIPWNVNTKNGIRNSNDFDATTAIPPNVQAKQHWLITLNIDTNTLRDEIHSSTNPVTIKYVGN